MRRKGIHIEWRSLHCEGRGDTGAGAAGGVLRCGGTGTLTTVRRAGERWRENRHRRTTWHTFDPGPGDQHGFGAIDALDEHELLPEAVTPYPLHRALGLVTYVQEGALSFEDAAGRPGILRAGEFQIMTSRSRLQRHAGNPSRRDRAHLFQVRLRPEGNGIEAPSEQRRFSAAERRGGLRVVASPDGRQGSLRITQDVEILSALLSPGHHAVHELLPGRSAWLHVVSGAATVGGILLTTGDGVGVIADRVVSMIAQEESEVLLLDVGDPGPGRSDGPRG